jgi:hypothetical protein
MYTVSQQARCSTDWSFELQDNGVSVERGCIGKEPLTASAHPEFFTERLGTGPEAIYNLILKIMLQKSFDKYNCNRTLFATAFIYIRI